MWRIDVGRHRLTHATCLEQQQKLSSPMIYHPKYHKRSLTRAHASSNQIAQCNMTELREIRIFYQQQQKKKK